MSWDAKNVALLKKLWAVGHVPANSQVGSDTAATP
jgi:hypothetical protein